MRHRDKGFTLVELLVTITVVAVLTMAGVPAFVGMMNKSTADNESSELYRALNYARLESITRGVAVRLQPVTTGAWNGVVNVQMGSTASLASILRVMPALSLNTVVSATSTAGASSYIEFNNLGALNFPLAQVTITYTRGTQVRTLYVCVNGRVSLGGGCT